MPPQRPSAPKGRAASDAVTTRVLTSSLASDAGAHERDRDKVADVRPRRVESSRPPAESLPPIDSVPPGSPVVATRQIGRCELFSEIASGGMATVHLGRWHGAGGFSKTVAVKRLHSHIAANPEFVRMLIDEARVVSRIRHPNVNSTIDVLEDHGELFIVMDYVHGVTLAQLVRQTKREREPLPERMALRMIQCVLHGLHAAHEATDEHGRRLNVIHRDVSPENIIVGVDGYAHLIDFGIARALGRLTHSMEGELKGKLSYLAPEQLIGEKPTAQTDVFSASIVLWQMLTGRRLFDGDNAGAISHAILTEDPPPPSTIQPHLSPELDRIVLKGLARQREDRWLSAADMADAIEQLGGMATHREVAEWVKRVGANRLAHVAAAVQSVERAARPPKDVVEHEPLREPPPASKDTAEPAAPAQHGRVASPSPLRTWLLVGAGLLVGCLVGALAPFRWIEPSAPPSVTPAPVASARPAPAASSPAPLSSSTPPPRATGSAAAPSSSRP
jgi:eukaryotic-like serine/threonine-protein kinase